MKLAVLLEIFAGQKFFYLYVQLFKYKAALGFEKNFYWQKMHKISSEQFVKNGE